MNSNSIGHIVIATVIRIVFVIVTVMVLPVVVITLRLTRLIDIRELMIVVEKEILEKLVMASLVTITMIAVIRRKLVLIRIT